MLDQAIARVLDDWDAGPASESQLRDVERDWAQVTQSAPGWVAIGDDSGGRVLLMKASPEARAVDLCSVAAISELSEYVHVTEDLHAWLLAGLELPDKED